MAVSVADLWVPLAMVYRYSDATRYNLNSTNAIITRIATDLAAYTEELERGLPAILQQMEEAKMMQWTAPRPHVAQDRERVNVIRRFALRYNLHDVASMCSSVATPATPSPQLSFFDPTDNTTASAYYTARLHQNTGEPQKYMPIYVRDVFGASVVADTDILIQQVQPELDLASVKSLIRVKIRLPYARFHLSYAGRVLSHDKASPQQYDIGSHAWFMCVSFGSNHVCKPLTLAQQRTRTLRE